MSLIHLFNRERMVRMTSFAAAALALGACTDDADLSGPDANLPASFAQGTYDGPKSVPTRGRILFNSPVTGDYELYAMNEDGTGMVRLTYAAGFDGEAAVSPDGRKIAFVSGREGAPQFYVMNADGSGIKKLTAFTGGAQIVRPSWSPDGRKLAIEVITDGNNLNDIYIMNANGSNLVAITSTPDLDGQPAFSPDGKRIAFTSNRSGSLEIWTVAVNGGNPTQLTQCSPMPCTTPAWSPDGSKIAYTAAFSHIDVMNLATLGVSTIVPEGVTPVWAPDGLRLAYSYSDNGTWSIATASAGGTNVEPLGNAGADSHASSWSR